MTLTEGLLTAIVIVLVLMMLTRGRGGCVEERKKTWDCIDRESGQMTSVQMQYAHKSGCQCPKCSSVTPEKKSLSENAEYFTNCGDSPDVRQDTGCDDKFAYAVNEFGSPGLDFKEWIGSQLVDPQVIKNHSEFVADRVSSNPQNITGKTFSPDSHDSYDPIPWIGVKGRPSRVPLCAPTQVSDGCDPSLYPEKQKLSWVSS